MAGRQEHQLEFLFSTNDARVDLSLDFHNYQNKSLFVTQIKTIHPGNIFVRDSFFGEIQSSFFTDFFDGILNMILSKLNKKIKKKAKNYAMKYSNPGVYMIEGLEIVNYNSYVEFGVSMDFVN